MALLKHYGGRKKSGNSFMVIKFIYWALLLIFIGKLSINIYMPWAVLKSKDNNSISIGSLVLIDFIFIVISLIFSLFLRSSFFMYDNNLVFISAISLILASYINYFLVMFLKTK